MSSKPKKDESSEIVPLQQELVSVRLVRSKDDPETLPVVINGALWNVPLGVETEVPENVALALIHSRHISGYPGFNPKKHPGVIPPARED